MEAEGAALMCFSFHRLRNKPRQPLVTEKTLKAAIEDDNITESRYLQSPTPSNYAFDQDDRS